MMGREGSRRALSMHQERFLLPIDNMLFDFGDIVTLILINKNFLN